jgi:hypothetical protein
MMPCLKRVKILSSAYEPNRLVDTVNILRVFGRDRCLQILRMYAAENPMDPVRDEDIQILCRFLFQRPGGWSPPILGAGVPFTTNKGERLFPKFPVAVTDGIPFILVFGFNSGGGGPRFSETLRECQYLPLINHDMERCGKTRALAAARKLTSSEAFQRLYRDQEQLTQATGFVLNQARRVGD